VKKIIGATLVLLVFVSMFGAVAQNNISADENYTDNSYEYGDGIADPDNAPDDYQSRDEPRTRNKDA
jgi:hypothetical protein